VDLSQDRTTYTYDRKDRVIEEVSDWDTDGEIDERRVYEYDGDGRMILEAIERYFRRRWMAQPARLRPEGEPGRAGVGH
jgi:hypothetical protein